MEEAEADLVAGFRERGIDLGALGDSDRAAITSNIAVGDPDKVGEQLAAALAIGFDGLTINLPLNGHVPERVALLGGTARQVVGI